MPLLRVLTDRGSEYCGNREWHEYALYLDLENIEHTRTKAKSPQTNGICERFHRTLLDEFYRVAFRKKIYRTIEDCRPIWMPGWSTTTSNGRIRAAGASARPRCRPFLTRSLSQRRN